MDTALIPAALLGVAFVAVCALTLAVRHVRVRPQTPADAAPNEPAVVAETSTEMTAEIYRSQLEAAGIRAFVRNAASLAYFAGFPLGRFEVYVRTADLEAARDVLGDITIDDEAPA